VRVSRVWRLGAYRKKESKVSAILVRIATTTVAALTLQIKMTSVNLNPTPSLDRKRAGLARPPSLPDKASVTVE